MIRYGIIVNLGNGVKTELQAAWLKDDKEARHWYHKTVANWPISMNGLSNAQGALDIGKYPASLARSVAIHTLL
jgi:hypothetical protein